AGGTRWSSRTSLPTIQEAASDPLLLELHVQPETADLVGQDVEAGGSTALDIVGLDSEQLLEDIGGAVGLQGPDFHLAEPLTAEPSLAAQRLLGDQGVRAGGAGVDLVVDKA